MLWGLKRRAQEKFGTQSDAAMALRISESIMSKVIRGRKKLSDSEKERWADALDCKVSDIFEQTGENTSSEVPKTAELHNGQIG